MVRVTIGAGQSMGQASGHIAIVVSIIFKMLISHYYILLDLIFVVTLQPRILILTKATMATMATKIMPTIKRLFFTMMQTLKLDNKLVHQITSIIIQKVSNNFVV